MAAGKEDIAPELLKKVQEDYRKRCENDKELARIEALAESGKANGKDTDAYAVRAGELLAAALHDNVSGDVLPDGRMYFNIASRVLPPVLRDNYELVAGMSTRIQQVLNDNAGLHMKALRPDLNEDRVKGLVNLAASADQYEDKRKELEADVVNFSQRISADGFHKNAEFQYTSGFNPKIRREAESGCCKWCQALEGTYDYADVRDTGNDVWRRHRDCRCVVEYDPGDGRRQNAHTKTWSQADDHRKKIEDAVKAIRSIDYDERRNERIATSEQEKKEYIAKLSEKRDNRAREDILQRYDTVDETQNFEELKEYMREKYGIPMDDTIRALDFRSVRESASGIEYVINEFPILGETIKEMATNDRGIMSSAYSGTIYYNKNVYNTREEVLNAHQLLPGQKQNATHPKGYNAYSSGCHEAGHMIEKALIDKVCNGDFEVGYLKWCERSYADDFVKNACEAARNIPECMGLSDEVLQDQISTYWRYSGNSPSETIAEAVSDYALNGTDAAPLSRVIWNMLKEEFE